MTINSSYLLPQQDYEGLYHAEHLLRALSDTTNDDQRGARVEVNRESLAITLRLIANMIGDALDHTTAYRN